MFLFGKRARKWEPVICRASDVIGLIEECVRIEAPLVRLNIEISGKPHKVGVTSDYDRRARKFFDTLFYLDEQTFTEFDDFKANANVDGQLFANIPELAVISDEDQGDPRINIFLADREKTYKSAVNKEQ